jgi:hypothetical protein
MYDLSPSLAHARERGPKLWCGIQTMTNHVQKDVRQRACQSSPAEKKVLFQTS